MVVDGTEYGEVRQYGNFSFARIYESGHEIPYYQRESPPRFFFQHEPRFSVDLVLTRTIKQLRQRWLTSIVHCTDMISRPENRWSLPI
jgi:hypothetical protein